MPVLARAPHHDRKPKRRYHHGDLRRALIDEALRTIQAEGVGALTVRAVGRALGVSRAALYRHFQDKAALLAAVGREGFRSFREALVAAWDSEGHGRAGLNAMGRAYVRFAGEHPSHYRVMFGGFLAACESDPELAREAAGAFQVLVEAITEGQRAGDLREDDPREMALFVWAIIHGVAMLVVDGQLRNGADAAVAYALKRLGTGIDAPRPRQADTARSSVRSIQSRGRRRSIP